MFCLTVQTDSHLLFEFTGACTNESSPDGESLVWWLSSIFNVYFFFFLTDETTVFGLMRRMRGAFVETAIPQWKEPDGGVVLFCVLESKPACNLDWKTTTFWAGVVIYDRLTVSGSFSNTSLASSLEHLSSTHSLSKCPCFVSSKT